MTRESPNCIKLKKKV